MRCIYQWKFLDFLINPRYALTDFSFRWYYIAVQSLGSLGAGFCEFENSWTNITTISTDIIVVKTIKLILRTVFSSGFVYSYECYWKYLFLFKRCLVPTVSVSHPWENVYIEPAPHRNEPYDISHTGLWWSASLALHCSNDFTLNWNFRLGSVLLLLETKPLIRLSGCSVWSESLLDADVKRSIPFRTDLSFMMIVGNIHFKHLQTVAKISFHKLLIYAKCSASHYKTERFKK